MPRALTPHRWLSQASSATSRSRPGQLRRRQAGTRLGRDQQITIQISTTNPALNCAFSNSPCQFMYPHGLLMTRAAVDLVVEAVVRMAVDPEDWHLEKFGRRFVHEAARRSIPPQSGEQGRLPQHLGEARTDGAYQSTGCPSGPNVDLLGSSRSKDPRPEWPNSRQGSARTLSSSDTGPTICAPAGQGSRGCRYEGESSSKSVQSVAPRKRTPSITT